MSKQFRRLKNFWKGKKVFLTGHSGFKGSWLIIFLDLLGAKVYGYSSKNSSGAYLYRVSNLKKIIAGSTFGDIRDYNQLKNSIVSFNPDFVVHFAAQPLVKKSYVDPKNTYDVNIMGTVNILNILHELNKIKAALIVTTDKVYNNNNLIKYFKESDQLGGNDPYSNSKACADSITNLYNFSFLRKKKIFVATARAGNVIGGGDNAADRIIPDYIRCLKNNQKLFLRYPKSIRPWQHVIEPLYGYLVLLEKLFKSRNLPNNNSWNFGPKIKNNKSVIEVVNILNNFFNNKVKIILKKNRKNLYESKILMLNSRKAKDFLSWKGILSLEETIKLIYFWVKDVSHKKNPLSICRNQILDYLKKV
jgi:CDP-glucose 4,6-dehydratase